MTTALEERIPDFQSLMYPLLSYLKDDKPHSLQDVMNTLAQQYQLTEDELRLKVPSGQMSLFKNRVAWALSYMKNAGLIFYPQRGVYQITDIGKSVFNENIESINIAYLKKFEGYKKWQSTFSQGDDTAKTIADNIETKTPEEIIGDTFKQLNEKLGFELLDLVKQKSPAQFEKFVLELLNKMGYGGADERNFEVVGQSGNNGIDGIIYQDKLGIDRIYVQAKKWTDNKVNSKEIRDFIGSLSLRETNKGVFITTSEFTEDAIRTVKMNPQNIIILIDGKKLSELAIEFNVGIQGKEQYQIKTLDMDFFEEL